MQKIEYDLPVFNDKDVADLNEYSKLVANALKVQIDKFGNPLTFKGTVETMTDLQNIQEKTNGDIYEVKDIEQLYIYNGNEWVVYSDTLKIKIEGFDVIKVDTLPTENIQEKTIYLVPNTETKENNIYDEYIYVNSTWEIIGSTAVDTDNLTVNLVENSYKLTLTEAVAGGETITVPSSYKVGADRLDVYLNGEKLIKATSSDTEGHYYEVGTEGTLSNTIQITSDWSASVGDVFEFTIRTNGQGVSVESDTVIVSNTEPTNGEKVWFLKSSKNLFDGVFTTGALLSDGTINTNNTDAMTTTNYIPVSENTDYIFSNTENIPIYSVCFYDENKNFVSRSNAISSFNFQTVANASYIKFTLSNTIPILTNAQLEKGTVATEYEQYREKGIYILNENNEYERFM